MEKQEFCVLKSDGSVQCFPLNMINGFRYDNFIEITGNKIAHDQYLLLLKKKEFVTFYIQSSTDPIKPTNELKNQNLCIVSNDSTISCIPVKNIINFHYANGYSGDFNEPIDGKFHIITKNHTHYIIDKFKTFQTITPITKCNINSNNKIYDKKIINIKVAKRALQQCGNLFVNILSHSAAIVTTNDNEKILIEYCGSVYRTKLTPSNYKLVREHIDYDEYVINQDGSPVGWTVQKSGCNVIKNITIRDAVKIMWFDKYSIQELKICHSSQEKLRSFACQCQIKKSIIKSKNIDTINKNFSNIAIKLTDYLIDHVPADSIDTTKKLSIRKKNVSIDFTPNELKFIKHIVKSNQLVQNASHLGKEMLRNIKYNENSRQCQIKLAHDTELVKILDNINIIKPTEFRLMNHFDKNYQTISQINTSKLTEYVDTHKYVNLFHQMIKHNSCPSHNSTAKVEYNDHDGWKIVFSVGISFGSFGGAGLTFCTIL